MWGGFGWMKKTGEIKSIFWTSKWGAAHSGKKSDNALWRKGKWNQKTEETAHRWEMAPQEQKMSCKVLEDTPLRCGVVAVQLHTILSKSFDNEFLNLTFVAKSIKNRLRSLFLTFVLPPVRGLGGQSQAFANRERKGPDFTGHCGWGTNSRFSINS